MTLDPGVRFVMDYYATDGPAASPTVEGARQGHEDKVARFTPRATRPVVDSIETVNTSPDGDGVPLRIYRRSAEGTESEPVMLWLHGGGWVSGSFDTADVAAREIAAAGAVVVVPEYRLSPEHPFPAGLEDCLEALSWTRDNIDRFGGDPGSIAVGGDSAGGNLAAVLAVHARDTGLPLSAQMLIYPVVDADYHGREYASRERFADGPLLTVGDMTWFAEQYLGGTDPADPRVSVLNVESLTGVAPAIVVTAGFDLLQDEGKAYVDALAAAEVPVLNLVCPTLTHAAFDFLSISPVARAAFRAAATATLELGNTETSADVD